MQNLVTAMREQKEFMDAMAEMEGDSDDDTYPPQPVEMSKEELEDQRIREQIEFDAHRVLEKQKHEEEEKHERAVARLAQARAQLEKTRRR